LSKKSVSHEHDWLHASDLDHWECRICNEEIGEPYLDNIKKIKKAVDENHKDKRGIQYAIKNITNMLEDMTNILGDSLKLLEEIGYSKYLFIEVGYEKDARERKACNYCKSLSIKHDDRTCDLHKLVMTLMTKLGRDYFD